MTKYFLIINVIILIIINQSKLGLCQECEAEFYIPSEVIPTDEICLLVNETLIVNCRLDTVTNDCHSSKLYFAKGNQTLDSFKIIDDATIQLIIPNMAEFNDVFNCHIKNGTDNSYGVGQVAVKVGYKPNIVNFSCLSINFAMMECIIDQISSPLLTKYSIEYGPTDSNDMMASRMTQKNFSYEGKSKIPFTIDQFSRVYRYYYIKIDLDYGLGIDSNTYWIDLKRIVKPIIESLSTTDITSKSAILNWRVSPIFKNYEFEHQVKVCQQNCNDQMSETWHFVDTQKTKIFNVTTFQLKINFDHAYTWYDIRVSTNVRNALYDDLWSYANGTVVQTAKRKPDSPPELAIGGFEIKTNETIIYWKEMPHIEWNANHMTYEIIEVLENGKLSQIPKPEYNSNNTTAKYYGLRHNDRDYQFKIISRNSEGRSNGYSFINIPRKHNRISPPHNLKKHLSNSIYNLSWNNFNDFTPDNYTIFWCDPMDEQVSLCRNLIDFAYVNGNAGNTFTYNNTFDKKTKIFAISANHGDKTSGMIWFPCSVTENQDMTVFPADLVVLGSSRMNISWNPQCATPLLKGFNISYCPIYKPNFTECNETKLYVEASNSYHIIENLLAYRTYRVKISMFNGKISGPIVELEKVTDSCQPTVPHDLGSAQITNSTIELFWNSPDYWNGEPQFYNISYKLINSTNHKYHKYYKIVDKSNDGRLPKSYNLTNLRSYSNYVIKIAGCNPVCSNFSNEIKIKTLIGRPDSVQNFKNSGESSSETYSWMPPEYKAGHLDFYELLLEGKINGTFHVIRKIQMTSTKCTPVHTLCNNNFNEFRFSVRAINIIQFKDDDEILNRSHVIQNNNINYHNNRYDIIKCREEDEREFFDCGIKYNCLASDWKAGVLSQCVYRSNTFSIIMVACFCIGLGMLIGLTLVCKKFQRIRDVGKPELPEGMEGIMETKPPQNHNVKHHNKPNGNLEDEQKARLISESKSIDDYRIYMDNGHFNGDHLDYSSYNSDNLPGGMLSTKQSTTNFLNSSLDNPYGYETESKPIFNYITDSNSSNYNYDGKSINHSETISYEGSTQSLNDSNIQSLQTENTNTDSNYVAVQQFKAPKINSPIMPVTANGYVCVNDFLKAKPIVSSNYVSFADLLKQNNTSKLAKNEIVLPENGYVKPSHLVGFENSRTSTN